MLLCYFSIGGMAFHLRKCCIRGQLEKLFISKAHFEKNYHFEIESLGKICNFEIDHFENRSIRKLVTWEKDSFPTVN